MSAAATLLASLLLPVVALSDAPNIVHPSGIYCSLRYSAESGDLLGLEIMVIPQAGENAWSAVVQVAEGGLPFIAIVRLKAVKDHFQFEMPPDSSYSHIRCEIQFLATEAKLSGSHCFDEHVLTRKTSYWE